MLQRNKSGFLSDWWNPFSWGDGPDYGNSQFYNVPSDKVSLFEHPEFKGKKVSLSAGVYDIAYLKNKDLNDKVSAIRVPPGMKITLYKDPLADSRAGGESVTVDKSIVNFNDEVLVNGFNDKVSAVKVEGTWNGQDEFYQEPTYDEQTSSSSSSSEASTAEQILDELAKILGNQQSASPVVAETKSTNWIVPVSIASVGVVGLLYLFTKKSKK